MGGLQGAAKGSRVAEDGLGVGVGGGGRDPTAAAGPGCKSLRGCKRGELWVWVLGWGTEAKSGACPASPLTNGRGILRKRGKEHELDDPTVGRDNEF